MSSDLLKNLSALPPNASAAQVRAAFMVAAKLLNACDETDAVRLAREGLHETVTAREYKIAVARRVAHDRHKGKEANLFFEIAGGNEASVAARLPAKREGTSETPPVAAARLEGAQHCAALRALQQASVQEIADNQTHTIVLPLASDESDKGVIIAARDTNPDAEAGFNLIEINILRSLAVVIGSAMRNARRIADAERLSQTDDLTSLRNARYLRDYLLSEIKRARRYGASVAVLFLDLDNFKSVNDEHGHLVGSQVLIEVAGAIADSVRDTDTVARYGGDEFVVVLPETDTERALQVAERVREGLARQSFTGGRGLQLSLTASFGVGSFPTNAQSAQQLLETADQAMYEAKSERKNCVRPAGARRFDFFGEK